MSIRKEKEKILKKLSFKKFFLLCNILEEIEVKYNINIEDFTYKKGEVLIDLGEHNYIRVDLSKEKYAISYN